MPAPRVIHPLASAPCGSVSLPCMLMHVRLGPPAAPPIRPRTVCISYLTRGHLGPWSPEGLRLSIDLRLRKFGTPSHCPRAAGSRTRVRWITGSRHVRAGDGRCWSSAPLSEFATAPRQRVGSLLREDSALESTRLTARGRSVLMVRAPSLWGSIGRRPMLSPPRQPGRAMPPRASRRRREWYQRDGRSRLVGLRTLAVQGGLLGLWLWILSHHAVRLRTC